MSIAVRKHNGNSIKRDIRLLIPWRTRAEKPYWTNTISLQTENGKVDIKISGKDIQKDDGSGVDSEKLKNILNKELEEKINDLKKVKHDYGAQISYLYGMHLMGKYDRLGESLKAIINGHNNIISEVEISDNNSMITMIINGINHKGINIMVD